MENVQWNSIDKKQNGLEQSKNDESSTLPHYGELKTCFGVYMLIVILNKICGICFQMTSNIFFLH